MSNQQLAEGLHKAITRTFKKHKVYFCFKDNIWGADLQMCSEHVNVINEFNFYYVLLIFTVNMHGLFV